MIVRRALLLGLAVTAALRERPDVGDIDILAPEDFGAVSGHVPLRIALANTKALVAALNGARLIDGGGLSYDVIGELRPTTAARLRSITLRQRSRDPSLEKTYVIDGIPRGEILMQDVVIDMAGLQQSAGMGQCSAIQISNCASVVFRNVSVINGGAITGAKIIGVGTVVVEGFHAHDFAPRYSRQPNDDVCQGIEFQRCRDFQIRGSTMSNLAAWWPDRPAVSRQYSRGIVCGQTRGGSISANSIGPGIEQGIDISSSANRGLRVFDNRVLDAGTWGIKCANHFRDIVIKDNVIERPGCAGIVCSAPGDATGEAPGDVTIVGNTITNAGASGLWSASEPAGIILYARVEAGGNAPSGITASGNRIVDDQPTHSMARGLDALTAPPGGIGPPRPWAAASGATPNREYDNVVVGYRLERARGWG